MKNKLLTLFLALAASVAPLFAETYSGTCGDNLTWTLDTESGTLTISGTGAMKDYFYNSSPWYSYYNSIKTVTIGSSVTSIGERAFYNCSSLTSITIPNSVTSIGAYAFGYCTSLTSITIPNSVTSIRNEAFYNCSKLTSITIPNSVTSIGEGAFCYCSKLTSITIPNSVTSIGEYAFDGCSSLTSVNVDAANSAYCDINGVLFSKDKTTLIQYPAGKTATSYTIPNSVTSIGGGAFYNCSSLTSVTIPNSVTSIGGYAFSGCSSLTSVTIPNSVTSIGDEVFSVCTGLTSITIPNSVMSIGYGAFAECSSLTSVTIPNSVTSIGEYAFYGCTGLTSITCEAVNPPALGESVFSNVHKSIPLYVPAQSIDLYKAADQWKNFTNILPITSSTPETFTITFLNYDGSELQSSEVEAGTMPQYNGATPTRPADDENTYTFSGWTPAVVAVAGNVSYTATFQSVPFVKYTITWQDEDGNVIKTDQVAQGTTPAFTGTAPTKPATNEYTYEFAGWLPKIQPATKAICYTTFFERNKIETPVYTVNINGENCSLNINNQYPEGTVITLEAVADECFEFQQWSDGNKENPRTVTVTANTNLTAEFNKVRYTVTGQPSTGGKVQIRKQ